MAHLNSSLRQLEEHVFTLEAMLALRTDEMQTLHEEKATLRNQLAQTDEDFCDARLDAEGWQKMYGKLRYEMGLVATTFESDYLPGAATIVRAVLDRVDTAEDLTIPQETHIPQG